MANQWMKLVVFAIVLSTAHHACGYYPVNITILHNAVSEGAVCLDGSPPAIHYHAGSGDGKYNWLLYLEGGAWCQDSKSCVGRFTNDWGSWGSSKYMPKVEHFQGVTSPFKDDNPYFYNWNRVFVRYCDGASFTADVEEVNPEDNIHRRGARILNYVVKHLMKKGMRNAKNAILTGGSAGGLATMLQCDNFKALTPDIPRVKCYADCGFFIEGKNLPAPEKREGYFSQVVDFHGLSTTLPKSCTSKMDPRLCIFPTNFIEDIKTPIFIVNSAFDGYQVMNNMKNPQGNYLECFLHDRNNCTKAEEEAIKDFGRTLVEELPKVDYSSPRGFFIDSCFFHDHATIPDRWFGRPMLKNKTIAQAIGDWYFDRSPFQEIELGTTDFPYNCSTRVY